MIEPERARKNRLLRALPEAVLSEFCEHFEQFEMTHGTPVFEPDEEIDQVLFPLTGAVS